ncbi:MAG: sugar metabolism transcriptional regulator [Calothrix sp. C42_A2020_038]|nr:sugar metabolism transcriptional regulator [Calothrix sp. C42_A2020_038]
MILMELQKFLSLHKTASLADLKIHFRMEAEPLRDMLLRLIRKGRVRKMDKGKKCGGCHTCSDDAIEFYEWVDCCLND